MLLTPLRNCNHFVHSIFRQNDERKSLARKVASLLFSSLLFLPGLFQIAFNISNLIKLSSGKEFSGCKFIFWNANLFLGTLFRLLTHLESKVVLLNLSNNKKTYDFTRTEKEHWLQSL